MIVWFRENFVWGRKGNVQVNKNDFTVLYCRQMRGEELEGLSVEELRQMERKLEAGLHRVLSTKVGWLLMVFSNLALASCLSWSFVYTCIFTQCMSLQDQLFLQQISELQQKVRNDYINPIAFVNCLYQTIYSRKLVKLGALMF